MLINKIRKNLGLNFFLLKKRLEIFNKIKKNYFYYLNSNEDKSFQSILEKGYFIEKNILNNNDINAILNKYLDSNYLNNEKRFDYNLFYPFFDEKILNKILSSETMHLAKKFFSMIYQSIPKFQQCPLLIITKPNLNNNEIENRIKIPATFHTDYPTEMSLHIPLVDLNENEIFTTYCQGSNRSYFVLPTTDYDQDYVKKFKQIKLTSNKGDGILLDTQGIHKAKIEKNSIRIMLFIKFSSEKNLLENIDYSSNSEKAKKSNFFKFDHEQTLKDMNGHKEKRYLNSNQLKIFNYFL